MGSKGAPIAEGRASKNGYELLRLFLRITMAPLARLHTEGIANIPADGPVILAVNHIHWTDIPFFSMRLTRITHYMAKYELFRVPVLRWVMRGLGSFPVRRGERDRDALKVAERLLREGEVVVIFPEGHRSSSGHLGVGHPGAALIALHTNAPIIPAAIIGTQRVLKPGLRYGPFRPDVTVRYGKPFQIQPHGRRVSREDLARGTDLIMYNIAALLPPEFRGLYTESPPTITPRPGADEPASLDYPTEDSAS